MGKRLRNENEVWNEIEKMLRYKLEPAIKDFLLTHDYVKEVLEGDEQSKSLQVLKNEAAILHNLVTKASGERTQMAGAIKLKTGRGLGQGLNPPNTHFIETTSEMRNLWSLFLARDITNSRLVTEFREQFIGERLLTASEVPGWIAQYVPEEAELIDVMYQMELIWDGVPEDVCRPWKGSEVNRIRPLLNAVRSVSETIVEFYGWGEPLGILYSYGAAISHETGWFLGETIWLILTGEPPTLPTIIACSYKTFATGGAKILMEIDPETSPDDVRQAFVSLRDKHNVRKRHSPPSDKIMAFMRFVLGKDGVNPRRPQRWVPLIDGWNELEMTKEKKWQFSGDERRHITQTYTEALERITPKVAEKFWSSVSHKSETAEDGTSGI